VSFNEPEYARLVELRTDVIETIKLCGKQSVNDAITKLKRQSLYNVIYENGIRLRNEPKMVMRTVHSMITELDTKKDVMSESYCTAKLSNIDSALTALIEIEGGMLW